MRRGMLWAPTSPTATARVHAHARSRTKLVEGMSATYGAAISHTLVMSRREEKARDRDRTGDVQLGKLSPAASDNGTHRETDSRSPAWEVEWPGDRTTDGHCPFDGRQCATAARRWATEVER